MNNQTKISFFNTINLNEDEFILENTKAQTQKELVYTVFQWNVRPLSWCSVERLLVEPMNQVSIKRCITDLYKEGRLIKTEEMEMGIYGKKVHLYKLA